MTETHDVALEGGGHALPRAGLPRTRAERRAAGVAARRCLHVRHARDARGRPGRPAAQRRRYHGGLGRLHAGAPRRARGARSARPRRGHALARSRLRAEMAAAGPRARFPVANLQIVAAFDWAVANAGAYGADPERVSLGGASAGANLSAGAAMRLRDRATTAPRVLALVYPVAPRRHPGPQRRDRRAAARRSRRRACSLPRAATRSTATTCPTATTRTATRSRAAMISRACPRC